MKYRARGEFGYTRTVRMDEPNRHIGEPGKATDPVRAARRRFPTVPVRRTGNAMERIERMAQRHPAIERLLEEHPNLSTVGDAMQQALQMLTESFQRGGKLLLCGNGGSACDCEHIAGELMKGFLLPRPLNAAETAALAAAGDDGDLAAHLQRALPVLVLHGLSGMSSAFLNDVRGDLTYAQQAFVYARPGDVLLGISTSGNATNVCAAAIAARARGARVIGLTGATGGRLSSYCDVCLCAPGHETYRIQEMHLPMYHALCIAVEATMFGGAQA